MLWFYSFLALRDHVYTLIHRYIFIIPYFNPVMKTNVVSQAAGSAYIEIDETKVICSM